MGGKTSKLFRHFTQTDPQEQEQEDSDSQNDEPITNHDHQKEDVAEVKMYKSPFVHHRRGSMFIDEDGDIAHEFYVETKEGSKVTLKRISNKHLTPQGDVPLDVPCIRNDYPVILLDQNIVKK